MSNRTFFENSEFFRTFAVIIRCQNAPFVENLFVKPNTILHKMRKSLLLLFAVVAAFVACESGPGEGTGAEQHYVQIERDTLYLG
jgi:hypothetical protein